MRLSVLRPFSSSFNQKTEKNPKREIKKALSPRYTGLKYPATFPGGKPIFLPLLGQHSF
jgi:hypothetical protein